MGDPTDGNWGSSGDNPLGGTSSSRRKRPLGSGFDAYLQDQLNRSGGLQPRLGKTTAFKGGELDGMNQAQAEAHLADKYGNMSDDEASQYEPTPAALPHEAGPGSSSSSPAYAGPSVSDDPQAGLFSPGPKSHQSDATPAGQQYQNAGSLASLPPVAQAPDAARGDYGATPDADLARLRTAGVVGQNETISDPNAFKAAVAQLSPPTPAYAGPTPPATVPPSPTSPTTAIIASTPPAPPVASTDATKPSLFPPSQPQPTFQTGDQLQAQGYNPIAAKPQTDVASQPPAPVIGSAGGTGPSDASGTANKYAGPPTPPLPSPGDDIDPVTGKKRASAM